MPKKTADKKPCECGLYEAIVGEVTEADVENGTIETESTGCVATTTRTFAPGHDARLKGFLIRWELAGYEIRRNEGGMAVSGDAESMASRYEFSHLVTKGIARGREKAQAKADRKTRRAAAKTDTAHDGNEARRARETKSLAEIVADEEAKHQAANSRPEPEWDDECGHEKAKADDVECPECGADLAIVDADEAVAEVPAPREEIVDLTDRPEVIAKVGRWEYRGVVAVDGTLHYLAKDGHTRKTAEAGKFAVLREI